jgi:cytochrome P450
MKSPAPERPPSLRRVLADIRYECSTREPLPPGPMRFSMVRTHRFQRHTLQMLLEYYERYGPVFAFRSVHQRIVAMIGAEANHFVTVSGADHFSWRKGLFGEHLTPLIGDGLITTDGEYHDRARRIMMPAFHRRRMDAAVRVMLEEAARSIESWRPGEVVDVYRWVRDLAMSIAMRALFGFDPGEGTVGHEAAMLFERALAFYDTENVLMLLRGPGSPWAKMQRARRGLDAVILKEIENRRARPAAGERSDTFSMLLDARDERGEGFTPQELRDQIMHLLFGGHDTTSSTLSFLMYELSRNPVVLERLLDEQDAVLAGRKPNAEELLSGLPYLSMVVAETLRLYPPVWFGPRLCVKPFEFHGFTIPAGIHVIHSSWVTHRLPEIFPNPEAFIPERFAPEARRRLPPGGYIPFGGGQRICIGKRFGQLVIKAVATAVLQRFRCELRPGYELRVSKLPTLSPEGGLPMVVRPRTAPAAPEHMPLSVRAPAAG